MSGIIVVIATVITIGTQTIPGASSYEWEVFYPQLAASDYYTTPEPMLEFDPLPGRLMRWRARLPGGEWSPWSYDVIADPLQGDANFDCVVGVPDIGVAGSNVGQACP